MKNDFVGKLLKTGDAELIKSYFVGHPLTIEEMKEIIKSQNCDKFIEFIHSQLFQQAKLVDVDTANSPEISAPVEVEYITEEADATCDKFLFQKIDVTQLFCEKMSSTVKDGLRNIENALFEKGIIYWGQIYTENQNVVKLMSSEAYRIFSANVERCFGRKVYDIPYIESVLAPMLSDFTHKKEEAEQKDKAENDRKERELRQKTPISQIFGKDTVFYQGLTRTEKNRVTRILKKIGEWSLSELKSFSPEDIKAELKSDELFETFTECITVEA